MKLLTTSINIPESKKNLLNDKVIEFNVNMNLSLINSKKRLIVQHFQSIVIIILIVSFLVVYCQLQYQVQILKAKTNSINLNLELMILRANPANNVINNLDTEANNKTVNLPANYLDFNSGNQRNSSPSTTTTTTTKTTFIRRFTRSVDKASSKNGVQPNRKILKKVRMGPKLATFIGAIPQQHVTNSAYVGPWIKTDQPRYAMNKFYLVEDGRAIEVNMKGLYLIATQLTYVGEGDTFSYWIVVNSEGSSQPRRVSRCSLASSIAASDKSCYTSAVVPLERGDRIYLEQRERNRSINLEEGYSFIQLTLLFNPQQKNILNVPNAIN